MANVWDVTLEDTQNSTNNYPVLPAGVYEFQVEKVTGKEYVPKPGGKMGRCAEIDLQLRIDTPEREFRVFDRLYSDPTAKWKMTKFAKCIGVFREGMTPAELLKAAKDAIGNCEIGIHQYQGKDQNGVKEYIFKEPVAEISDEDLPF